MGELNAALDSALAGDFDVADLVRDLFVGYIVGEFGGVFVGYIIGEFGEVLVGYIVGEFGGVSVGYIVGELEYWLDVL